MDEAVENILTAISGTTAKRDEIELKRLREGTLLTESLSLTPTVWSKSTLSHNNVEGTGCVSPSTFFCILGNNYTNLQQIMSLDKSCGIFFWWKLSQKDAPNFLVSLSLENKSSVLVAVYEMNFQYSQWACLFSVNSLFWTLSWISFGKMYYFIHFHFKSQCTSKFIS